MTMSDRLAVMRHGRIEQLGTPEEVYERPATQFVAGFLGASNLLPGEVKEQRNGEVTVLLSGGSAITVPAVEWAPVGAMVKVGVRPEKITIGPEDGADAGGRNSVSGLLRMSTYVGVSHQFTVEGPDGEILTVYQQNLGDDRLPGPGETVRLSWRPEHTFVVLPEREEADEEEES